MSKLKYLLPVEVTSMVVDVTGFILEFDIGISKIISRADNSSQYQLSSQARGWDKIILLLNHQSNPHYTTTSCPSFFFFMCSLFSVSTWEKFTEMMCRQQR